MLDRIKSLLGTLIKDGEPAKAMKRIPCVVHEGESYTPGTTVNFGLKIFVVKHVFISNDLMKCSLMVTNVANETDNSYISEEIMLGLDEVIPMQDWELSEQLQTVCKNVASNSYSELFEDIPCYPLHIQRVVRKHMLISKLRRTIHYFLTGLAMVGNFNLGLIDWEHDPHILKHTILVYKIEDSQHDTEVNELDVLLGPKWDMVDMSVTMDSFRIVLTMEIKININGELCVTGHAATCALVPDTNGCEYRAQYLKHSIEVLSEMTNSCRVGAVSQASGPKPEDDRYDGSLADQNKTSLLWDSFNAQKEPNMFSTPMVQHGMLNLSEEASILSTPTTAIVGIKSPTSESGNSSSRADTQSRVSTAIMNLSEENSFLSTSTAAIVEIKPLMSESGNSSSRTGTQSCVSQSTAIMNLPEENSFLSTSFAATVEIKPLMSDAIMNLSEENSILSNSSAATVEIKPPMSESGNSSCRTDTRSFASQSTASTRPRLQGLFQTGPFINNQRLSKNNDDSQIEQQCPFPNEWQFGTVPEVITNDEDID